MLGRRMMRLVLAGKRMDLWKKKIGFFSHWSERRQNTEGCKVRWRKMIGWGSGRKEKDRFLFSIHSGLFYQLDLWKQQIWKRSNWHVRLVFVGLQWALLWLTVSCRCGPPRLPQQLLQNYQAACNDTWVLITAQIHKRWLITLVTLREAEPLVNK